MKNYKRLTAMVLSIMMILSMMPAMAFAEGEAAEADAAVEAVDAADADGEMADMLEDGAADIEDLNADVDEELIDTEAADDAEAYNGEDVLAGEETSDGSDGFSFDTSALDEALADDEEAEDIPDDSDFGEASADFGLGIDEEEEDEIVDTEEQVEEFLLSDDDAPDSDEVAESGVAAQEARSIKGTRLSGKDLTFYKAFKTVIKNVSARKTSSTQKKLGITKITGRRTFTARQLGVSKIGYKKNGVWYVSGAAMKKINALISPKDWKRVYMSLMADLTNDSFWVDWHTKEYFIWYNCGFRYNANSITFYSNDSITCRLAVQSEFQGSTYKANLTKIKSAISAKEYAKALVQSFNEFVKTDLSGYTSEEIDWLRLWNYSRYIAYMNTYDHAAADADYDTYWYKGPWSWVYVFDRDSSTNVVCEGYARAYKLLCDMSKFRSNWIDCQIVTGKVGSEKHMWNIVRMNDGLNYVVDPTWMDEDDSSDAYAVNNDWFLKGAPSGTADGYTINGSTRKYDSWTKKAFASAERKLSAKTDYEFNSSRTIKLKATKIKKLVRRSKAFTLKWSVVKSPLGALYIDGYQIQYGTKSSFKGAKAIKVKGFAKSKTTIKKLRSGKKYYVRIRTYAKMGSKTYYSKWSKKKSIKVR